MKKVIFITGIPRIGKSTVLMRIIELLKREGIKIGGIITPEKREGNKRIGFLVKDIISGEEGTLAKICTSISNKPKFGKYIIDIEDFERIALKALDFSLKNCDIIAMDEIGRMEFFSLKFKEKIYEILNSNRIIIAVLHRDFINQFKKYGEIIEVTLENRNKLPEEIFKKILKFKK
ncbi:MAG: NTPase [Nitrososphaerota archaeon]